MGKPPCARYGHSMAHNPNQNTVIIFGGQDNRKFLDDVYVLQLSDLAWINCITMGAHPLPRASHQSAFYENKMIVFGGLNSEGYLGNMI